MRVSRNLIRISHGEEEEAVDGAAVWGSIVYRWIMWLICGCWEKSPLYVRRQHHFC